ncbi:MAG: HsdM family class I SAM-dependent methyltransferase [Promethearchaeota archaeon]
MSNISNIYGNKSFNLEILNKDIKKLEDLLLNHRFYENTCFKTWEKDFKTIYSNKHITPRLYIIFALLYLVGHILISKIIFNNNRSNINEFNLSQILTDNQVKSKSIFNDLKLFELHYFDPILELIKSDKHNIFHSIVSKLLKLLLERDLNPEYYYDFFMQNALSSIVRHSSGEFYTPPFIVKKMIDDSYSFGDRVLDPCCGSGNFLIEIIKKILESDKTETQKIAAINNIYGYDINPLSIFFTRINSLLTTEDLSNNIKLNLFTFDSLFQNTNTPNIKFDLVIGNPPWYTYRDVESSSYQQKIKNLAEELEIKPLPKNILNIEISALFFYQARQMYLKDKGKIFFVITKGVITGSHASRFRNFKGFKNVRIWNFSKKIEKIFNIDFICLYAQNSVIQITEKDYEIPTYYFKLKTTDNLNYFDNVDLDLEKVENLVPYSIEVKGNKIYTKKLIQKDEKEKLLPYSESYYKKLFHKGADLNPRNLIFVECEEVNKSQLNINPDERIFKRAKTPWNKKEFKDEIVEKEFLFKTIKSTELVKFNVYDYYTVFLPLSKEDLSFNYDTLPPNAKNFYDKINKLYLTYKKKTTKHNSLMDNLNRWNKLINPRQSSKIKVVYNNSGSILNSSIIQGDFLVTGDLSFYATDNLDEAYYLIAILNSDLMTKQIQIKKSSRHIFKIPFETAIKKFNSKNKNHTAIKKFNSKNKNHIKLSRLGRMGEDIVKKSISDFKLSEVPNRNLSKIKLQSFLSKKLEHIIQQIDTILQLELK